MQLSDINLNPSELEKFYSTYFSYYSTLSKEYKQLFVERCQKFITEKEITGEDNFIADNRVKAFVAASAVQLTLGLQTWQLAYFDEIIIHAADFDNAEGDTKFIGETNLSGYIKLSWASLLKGYQIKDDNLNLGIHEFTHALKFNNIRGGEQDYFIENYFDSWLAAAQDAFQDINNNKETIFRKYGGANINEFLSVCIEHYFESPEEIKTHYPVLYYSTGILLNQNSTKTNTRIGIRNEFFNEKNKLLLGFTNQSLKTSFVSNWTFKLWIGVAVIMIFNSINANHFTGVNVVLLLIFIGVFFYYQYTAVKIEIDKTKLIVEKGTGVFSKRKVYDILISQLVSIKVSEDELSFTYYNQDDDFFYEEKISSYKNDNEILLQDCMNNRITHF